MIKRLTDTDQLKLKNLNLFRLDNNWFMVLYLTSIFLFIYSFFYPYFGWKHKPLNPPTELNEYLRQVSRMITFCSPMYLIAICNFLIKAGELKKGIKIINVAEVKVKMRLILKRRFILFTPFLVVVYKRPLQHQDLKNGSKVRMELTYFGRLLNYEVLTKI